MLCEAPPTPPAAPRATASWPALPRCRDRLVATAPGVEHADPLAGAMLADGHLEALVRHADDYQANPRSRVEPAVEQAQLWRARLNLEEAERGARQ